MGRIKKNVIGFWLFATTSVCLGLLLNQFRDHPQSLVYASKQQRLGNAVAQVAATGTTGVTNLGSKEASPKNPLTDVDQLRFQAYLEAVKKRPSDAFNEAIAVWKWNDSVALQQLVFTTALKKVSSSDESESLQFMLKALDDPTIQWQECERQSRGNSLEKSIAAKRIALLEANPKVREAKGSVVSTSLSFPQVDHPQVISWQDVRSISESKKGVILDARQEKIYRLGHVPGALNLSREGFSADYAKQKALLESDKNQVIVVYCAGLDCEDSLMVAGALVKFGFRRVLIFKGGWSEWTFQHLPQVTK